MRLSSKKFGANLEGSRVKADVGILFVHGIGVQRKGTQVGPLARAIERFLRRPDTVPAGQTPFEVDISSAVLTSSSEPSHVHLALRREGTKEKAEWLIAESLWSDSFVAPTVWETLLWLLMKAPLLLTTRAIEGVQRSWARIWHDPLSLWRVPLALLWCFLVFPVGLLLILAVMLLTLLRGVIPFAWLKDLIAKVELFVTDIIGDSYLYTEDSVSGRAMETAVARDLGWLRERSTKVVIVAHSQGASVVSEALERHTKVDVLVTLGAGIGQLAWLKRLSPWSYASASISWALGLVLLVVVSAILIPPLFNGDTRLLGFILMIGGLTVLPKAIFRLLRPSAGETRSARAPALKDKKKSVARVWEDLWATSDPVPGGSATEREFSGVTSIPVWNSGDLVRDHAAYLRNETEVIARVTRLALGLHTPPEPAVSDLAAVVPVAGGLRGRRGTWIERLRVVLVVAFVVILARLAEPVFTIGPYWIDRVRELGLLDFGGSVWPDLVLDEDMAAAAISVLVVALITFGLYLVGLFIVWLWSLGEGLGRIRRQLATSSAGFGSPAGLLATATYVSVLGATTALLALLERSALISFLMVIGTDLAVGFALGLFAFSGAWADWTESKVSILRRSTQSQRIRGLAIGTGISFIAELPIAFATVADRRIESTALFALIGILGYLAIVAVATAIIIIRGRPASAPSILRYYPDLGTTVERAPVWALRVAVNLLIIAAQVLAFLYFWRIPEEAWPVYAVFPMALAFLGSLGMVESFESRGSPVRHPLDGSLPSWVWGLLFATSAALGVAFAVRLGVELYTRYA